MDKNTIIPTPQEIRNELAEALRRVNFLKKLLKLSEQHVRDQKEVELFRQGKNPYMKQDDGNWPK